MVAEHDQLNLLCVRVGILFERQLVELVVMFYVYSECHRIVV